MDCKTAYKKRKTIARLRENEELERAQIEKLYEESSTTYLKLKDISDYRQDIKFLKEFSVCKQWLKLHKVDFKQLPEEILFQNCVVKHNLKQKK